MRPMRLSLPGSVVRSSLAMASGLLFITVTAHWPALHGAAIWDDDAFVTENRTLHEPGGLGRIWFHPEASPHYYPLLLTTWWIEYRLTGLDLTVSHGVNVLLHALCALVLWRVLKRIGAGGAWFAAALFAVHPVTVESVAWLTERKNTLSMALFLLSILVFLRFEDAGDEYEEGPAGRRKTGASGPGVAQRVAVECLRLTPYLASLCLFTMALLAKVAVATMPLLLLLLAWWRRGRVTRADVMRVVPFFIVAFLLGLAALYHEYEYSIAFAEPRPEGLWSRLVAAGWCVWFYLFKVAMPLRLSMIYPRWDVDPASVVSWLPLSGLLAVAVAAWWRRSTWGRAVLAALGAYVAMLLPVLGVVDIGYFAHSLVADHFQYFAFVAPLCLVVAIFRRLAAFLRPTPAGNVPAVVVAVGVVAVLSALTWHRCRLYASPAVLWSDTVLKNPASLAARGNLGLALQSQGRVDETIGHLRAAIAISPESAEAHGNLGVALATQGRVDEAIACYHRALQIDSRLASAHHNLGVALKSRGRVDEAIVHHREAVRIKPGSANSHSSLGVALASQGRLEEAIACYRLALRINPRFAQAHNNLGIALRSQGRIDEAVGHHHLAIRIEPDFAEAYSELGVALASRGSLDDAIAHFRRALQIEPDHGEAHFNLGIALSSQGCLDDAVAHYRRALQINPSHSRAHYNLGNVLASKGRLDEAVAHYREALRINPSNPLAHNNLGTAYAKKGEFDKAVAEFTEAIRLNPKYAEAYYNRAVAHGSNGEQAKAAADFATAKRIGYSPE